LGETKETRGIRQRPTAKEIEGGALNGWTKWRGRNWQREKNDARRGGRPRKKKELLAGSEKNGAGKVKTRKRKGGVKEGDRGKVAGKGI